MYFNIKDGQTDNTKNKPIKKQHFWQNPIILDLITKIIGLITAIIMLIAVMCSQT